MKKISYTTSQEDTAERLDTFISSKSEFSRSHVQKLIKDRLIQVNSQAQKAGYKLRRGDTIDLNIPDEPETILMPEDIPLEILFEDRYIVAVNKPPGMVMYPAAGHKSGTLMNALIAKGRRLASTGAPLRPGIVHRIDKDTSGLIIIAKDDKAYLALIKKFKEREIEKEYMALIYGAPKEDKGEIKTVIGRSVSDRKKMSTKTKRGKEAVTKYEVVKRLKAASLLKVKILTGRTHQIRVHFASIGHPVLGDRTYGKKTYIRLAQRVITFPRQMLHACSLKLKHPVTGRPVELNSPMPDDMQKAIEELRG